MDIKESFEHSLPNRQEEEGTNGFYRSWLWALLMVWAIAVCSASLSSGQPPVRIPFPSGCPSIVSQSQTIRRFKFCCAADFAECRCLGLRRRCGGGDSVSRRGSHTKTATPRHTLMQRNRRTNTGRTLIRIRGRITSTMFTVRPNLQ